MFLSYYIMKNEGGLPKCAIRMRLATPELNPSAAN